MTRKKTKFCLSWPNKMLKKSGRLWNIGILLTDRTIMPYWSLIFPLSSLFYRMWRHFSLDDLDTQKVPGVAGCSPPPLGITKLQFRWRCWGHMQQLKHKIFAVVAFFHVHLACNLQYALFLPIPSSPFSRTVQWWTDAGWVLTSNDSSTDLHLITSLAFTLNDSGINCSRVANL